MFGCETVSDIDFAKVLVDLTEFISRHLSEGVSPNDIIMALEQAKFSMMVEGYEQGKALLRLHPELFVQNGIERK